MPIDIRTGLTEQQAMEIVEGLQVGGWLLGRLLLLL